MRRFAACLFAVPLLLPAACSSPTTGRSAGAASSPAAETLAYVPNIQGEANPAIAVSSPAGAPPSATIAGTEPALSPDGSRLAWVQLSPNAGTARLVVGATDGSGARDLTDAAAYPTDPAWAPDGTRIAYVDKREGGRVRIVLADGSADRPVGPVLPWLDAWLPLWSPDGRFLAVNGFDSQRRSPVVTVLDTSGGGSATLTWGLVATDWSPDGTTLAVRLANGLGLYRLGDRTTSTVVTNPQPDFFKGSRFSPSGQALYVNAVRYTGGGKGDFTAVLERWSVAGVRDTSFPPLSLDYNQGSFSVGGGARAVPERTTPAPVTGLTAMAAPSRVTLRFARPTAATAAGVTIRYAVGGTPPATVTDGMSAGESLASAFTVGRLAPSTTFSFSVFTRDWSGAASAPVTATATTPAQAGTTLTLTGPATITYGQSSALTGTLARDDTGDPVPGARVQLLGHHTGRPDRLLATLTTDGAGHLSATRLTSQNTRYTVRYAGNATLTPAAASTLVRVRQRVTLTLSPSGRVPAHSMATVTAVVAPAFPGGNMRVQQQLYTHGVNVLTRLDAGSRVTVRLDTSLRTRSTSVAVTPGARIGYVNEPAYTQLAIY